MSSTEQAGAWPPSARDAAPVPAAEPLSLPIVTVTVTCVFDGHSHAIPDVELTSARSGCYRAVCGHVVTAAPMVAPEGIPCPSCDEARQTRPARPARRLGLRRFGG